MYIYSSEKSLVRSKKEMSSVACKLWLFSLYTSSTRPTSVTSSVDHCGLGVYLISGLIAMQLYNIGARFNLEIEYKGAEMREYCEENYRLLI